MITIHFNLDDLPTASMIQPTASQWHGLTLSELDEIDSIDAWGIRQFIAGCLGSKPFDAVAVSPDVQIPEIDEDKPIMLLKYNDSGVAERLYGAALFKNEENSLILKSGNYEFPVSINLGGTLSVGVLHGELELEQRGDTQVIVLILYNAQLEIRYVANIRFLSLENLPSIYALKNYLANGQIDKFVNYLAPVPSGTVRETLKMSSIEVGEYLVKEIREVTTTWGATHILDLGDCEVWSAGNVSRLLKRNFKAIEQKLNNGSTLTLSVNGHRQVTSGVTVDCALYFKKPTLEAWKNRPMLGSAEVVEQKVQLKNDKTPVSVTTVSDSDVQNHLDSGERDLDPIPF